MIASPSRPSTERPAYTPRGAAWDLLHTQDPEVLISGPAGTGKSLACCWKMHLCAESVPGFRGLIARQTRKSLTDSTLVTFERFVLPERHPAKGRVRREGRHSYRYPNGAEIVCGGLDEPSRIMSTEFDMAYIPEAIEVPENTWEAITTRLRNNQLPYQQLLADTNPDSPQHWLKRRCEAGKTVMLESRHQDNPLLWDADLEDWTPFGRQYIAKLDALTGPRKQRLRHGRWVQAEGVVYDGFDRRLHLIDRFNIPRHWPRYWAVDFGFTNSFSCLFGATDPDGRLYIYREIYHTQRLVEDHAKRIKWITKDEPPPRAIICDHDAEGRATLERHLGMKTRAASKAITRGIQVVAARLRPAGDGKPRLFIMRDTLDQRDTALEEAKKPQSLIEEFDAYIWDTSANRKKGEVPVDENNHGLDALRYLCMHLDEPRVRVGGL